MIASGIFADHVLGIEWKALSAFTQVRTLAFLEDTLAVGIAGVAARYADEVHGALQGWGSGGACGVLGRPGVTLPAPQAAFLNAFQIHAQEFDCVHEAAVLHPMTVVLSALMAEAQRGQAICGADLLAGIVAGVDVAVGLGVAATTPIRFFRPATAGIFGAVAALCRVRRLGRPQALDAFGYALAFASGTMQPHTEGKPALAVQMAHAAQAAVMALDIALAGLPGPLGAIDGVYGYLPMMESGFDLDRVLPVLGRPHRIDEVSWKPFPSGRATHGAVVATQDLVREHGITAENLESLVYLAPPLIRHLCGRPMQPGVQVAQARLCIPFATSMVLMNGTVALSDYTEQRFSDPAVLALAARIVVEVDGNADPAAFVPATAVARTKDGREARVFVSHQFGSPARPLAEAQRTEKLSACLDFAGMAHLHAPLTAMIENFADSEDAGAAFRIAQGDAT